MEATISTGIFSVQMKDFFLSMSLAVPLVVVICWLGGRIYRHHRDSMDTTGEGNLSRRELLFEEFNLGSVPDLSELTSVDAKEIKRKWEDLHRNSVSDKQKYFTHIGRCGTALALLLLCSALSVTVARWSDQSADMFATLDVIAVVYILVEWLLARRASKRWIASRVRAELMRQWSVISRLAGLGSSKILSDYNDAVQRINAEVLPRAGSIWHWIKIWVGGEPTPHNIDQSIRCYWQGVWDDLFARESGKDLPARMGSVYIYDRPIRQLNWFRVRRQQITSEGHSRGRIVILLYFLTLALAVAGVIVQFDLWMLHGSSTAQSYPSSGTGVKPTSRLSDWLALCVLLTSAASAAITYLYLSRNARSLNHRYNTQMREIELWLRELPLSNLRNAHDRRLLNLDKAKEFEDIMIGELIDWVYITSNDVAELGA